MTLTAEQANLWERAYPDRLKPCGEQTQEQAENFAVASFIAAYAFDSLEPIPAPENVRAHMRGA